MSRVFYMAFLSIDSNPGSCSGSRYESPKEACILNRDFYIVDLDAWSRADYFNVIKYVIPIRINS